MKHRFFLFLFSFSFSFLLAQNSGVEGYVADSVGHPVPFSSVRVQGSSNGTSANENGMFKFLLEPGEYLLSFYSIGYDTKTINVKVHPQQFTKVDITLDEQSFEFGEIVITAGEDPAYPIMRKVIEKREFHLKQVLSFTANAYCKSLQRIYSAPDKVLGQKVNIFGTLDSNNAGILYLSESVSTLSYRNPDQVHEEMISSKVSGRSRSFSWNRAGEFLKYDIYENSLHIDGLTDRVLISPVADNAFFYYKYLLVGSYLDEGHLIHKIKVIPRRKNDPVYSGHIYVVEGLWNLKGLDLLLTKNNQINFVDTLFVTQEFSKITDSVWMPFSKRFEFNFSILGISAGGYFISVLTDYQINPVFNKGFFSNEVLTIKEISNQKDSLYWAAFRPVPLTSEEINDYIRKDSFERLRESKAYLDSLDKRRNTFKPIDILVGYNYDRSYRKISFGIDPPINFLQFNTIEGMVVGVGMNFRKRWEKSKSLDIESRLRYGIAINRLQNEWVGSYYYNGLKRAYLRVTFGRYVRQFDGSMPVSELVNTAYSLIGAKNYIKLYQEAFFGVTHRIELANGLMSWFSLKWSARERLKNNSFYTFRDNRRERYTSNTPQNQYIGTAEDFHTIIDDNILMESHNALTLGLTFEYVPGTKFISRPYQKIIIDSKFPTFRFSYVMGVPLRNVSDVHYHKFSFAVTKKVSLKLLGSMDMLGRISYLNIPGKAGFMDIIHHRGNLTIFGKEYDQSFLFLDYYLPSTITWGSEIHFQHHLDGFFFQKIPGIRKLKLQEVYGSHFLYNPAYGYHTEVTMGIENIFRILRVDYVLAFDQNYPARNSFRIGIDLTF